MTPRNRKHHAARSLAVHGHDRSLATGLAVDAGGAPLPMYTHPAIKYLTRLDFSQHRMLGSGTGRKAWWWVAQAGRVTASEQDDHWVARLEQLGPTNVVCLFAVPEGIGTGIDYLAVVPERGRLDVLALDWLQHYYGAAARRLLDRRGFVILDNAVHYTAICALPCEADFPQIDFAGFVLCHRDAQVTPLFLDRVLAVPPRNRQPHTPIGGKSTISPFDKPRRIAFRDGKMVIS
ncbi:MAG: hypothetical protein HKM95_02775 [Inquilinus sp.]|nr:hypothetical protein [Inquilinus sp.]